MKLLWVFPTGMISCRRARLGPARSKCRGVLPLFSCPSTVLTDSQGIAVSLGCHDKYHRLGGLQPQKLIFLTVLEAGCPRSRCHQCLMRALSSGCRWLPSHCDLTWQRERGRGGERERDGGRQREREITPLWGLFL